MQRKAIEQSTFTSLSCFTSRKRKAIPLTNLRVLAMTSNLLAMASIPLTIPLVFSMFHSTRSTVLEAGGVDHLRQPEKHVFSTSKTLVENPAVGSSICWTFSWPRPNEKKHEKLHIGVWFCWRIIEAPEPVWNCIQVAALQKIDLGTNLNQRMKKHPSSGPN